MGNQTGRLPLRIILPKGHEIVILPRQQPPDVLCATGEAIVGGNAHDDWPAVAQMGFCRHGDGGIRDGVTELCQGVACAWGDDEGIEKLLRPDGLRVRDGADGLDARDLK